jgi:hypothetical protein
LGASVFNGAGTGLTGTASGLSIGGNATTATTATNVSGGTASVTTLTTTGNATLGDAITDSHVANGRFENNGPVQSNIVSLAADTLNLSLGNYFTRTINANTTFVFTNPPSGKAFGFTLELNHTSGTVTWPAAVKWSKDAAPVLSVGKTHLFVFVTDDNGVNYRGAALVDYTT